MGQIIGHSMPQQNTGGHSNPPTPQSQTPSGIHGGSSTPGPSGQTPTPQQTVMFQGVPQPMPPHSVAGNPYGPQPPMVLMTHQHHIPGNQGPHMQQLQMQPVMNSSAPLVNTGHFQPPQNQQPPGR